MKRKHDPVGAIEIAARLGVKERTVHMWLFRELMPEPDFPSVNGTRAWDWNTILRWAGTTGHIHSDEARAEYTALTGGEPIAPRKGGRPVSV
jgi:hypothetical protein